jgi:uncharacterized membrane protein
MTQFQKHALLLATMELLLLIIAQIMHRFGMVLTVFHAYYQVTGTMILIGASFALQDITTMSLKKHACNAHQILYLT